MSRRLLAIVFSAAFGVFLVVGMPLSVVAGMVAGSAGLRYDYSSGTVWSGTLHNAHLGVRHLGDLRLTFNPLHLALARVQLGFSFDGREGAGSGVIETGFGSYFALKDATMQIEVENIVTTLGLSGTMSLEGISVVMDEASCRAAEGELSTDILTRNATALGWEGPLLAGVIECRDGALYIPMSGARGGETVEMQTLLFADRRYETSVSVTTEDQRLAQVLAAVGFSNDAGVLALEQAGRWAEDQFDMLSAGG